MIFPVPIPTVHLPTNSSQSGRTGNYYGSRYQENSDSDSMDSVHSEEEEESDNNIVTGTSWSLFYILVILVVLLC